MTRSPLPARRTGGHPAKRTFQALRIAVNAELESLTAALPGSAGRAAAGRAHRGDGLPVAGGPDRQDGLRRRDGLPHPEGLPVELPGYEPEFVAAHPGCRTGRRRGDRAQSAQRPGPAARRQSNVPRLTERTADEGRAKAGRAPRHRRASPAAMAAAPTPGGKRPRRPASGPARAGTASRAAARNRAACARDRRPHRRRGPSSAPARPKTTSQAKARAKARKAKAPKVIRLPLRERMIARLRGR